MRPDFPCRAADTAYRMVDDEMIVVTASGSNILALNRTGALVWELADGSRSLDDLAAAVCEEFAVDVDLARRDVLAFVDALDEEGLLESSAEAQVTSA